MSIRRRILWADVTGRDEVKPWRVLEKLGEVRRSTRVVRYLRQDSFQRVREDYQFRLSERRREPNDRVRRCKL